MVFSITDPIIELHYPREIRRLSAQDFEILAGYYSKNRTRLVTLALRKADLLSLGLLVKGQVCKLFARPPYSYPFKKSEQDELSKRLITGADPTSIVIRLGSKVAEFRIDALHSPILVAGLLNEVILQNQYNLSEENIRGKTVIDAGANIGVFSVFAAMMGAKRVYAFEPLEANYLRLQESVRASGFEDVIFPLKNGLGDHKTRAEIQYHSNNLGGAMISDAGVFRAETPEYTETIEITTLDDFMSSRRESVDFIKMDVEGYEENVLVGAQKTIQTHHPALSFSAYHKPSDKVRLPEVVHSISADYTCRLLQRAEEDFYCE